MRWPVLGSRSGEPAADVAQQVDAGLRRWRTSVVPVEDAQSIGERRAKTLSTIGAAMRQAQLERQHSHQQRRWRYALSAAAMLLGLGGAVYAGAGYYSGAGLFASTVESQAVLTGQAGRVWVGNASPSQLRQQAPLAEGATHALVVGDRVLTQLGGEADLDVGRDTQVQLHQQSELLLARNDHVEKRLSLREGVIDVRVEHAADSAAPKRSVVVETPNATVVVHGTVFSVGVASATSGTVTTVSVRRGVVAILQNGVEQRRLQAGESWSSHAPQAAEAPSSVVAGGDEVLADEAPHASHAVLSGASKHHASARGPVAATAASHATAASKGSSDASSSTLEQENALFRLAVDARNSGDDAAAVRYFDQLLTTYPKSALAQEAKVERFRALRRMGRGRDAAREARRYLIEHGNGFAEDEARDVALTPGP